MRTCTWITVVMASWLISPVIGAEPKTSAEKEVEIRSPLPGISTILMIVKDGAKVRKGDLLITLDSSDLQTEREKSRMEVAVATAETIAAKNGLQRAEVESKRTDVADLAQKVAELRCNAHSVEMDLELKMIEREIEVAQQSLELIKRHVKNTVTDTGTGNSFEEAAAGLERLKAEAALETATNKKRLFEIMRPLKKAELELAITHAKMDCAVAKCATAEELETAKASLAAHEQKLQMEKARLKRIEELITLSAIVAPSDGVVRHVAKARIAEGAHVRERQPLLILIRE